MTASPFVAAIIVCWVGSWVGYLEWKVLARLLEAGYCDKNGTWLSDGLEQVFPNAAVGI